MTFSIHFINSSLYLWITHFLAQIILNSQKLILLSTICLNLSMTTILSTFHPMMTTSEVHLSRSWITFIFLFPRAQFIPISSLTDPFYFRRYINDDDSLDFSSHDDYISHILESHLSHRTFTSQLQFSWSHFRRHLISTFSFLRSQFYSDFISHEPIQAYMSLLTFTDILLWLQQHAASADSLRALPYCRRSSFSSSCSIGRARSRNTFSCNRCRARSGYKFSPSFSYSRVSRSLSLCYTFYFGHVSSLQPSVWRSNRNRLLPFWSTSLASFTSRSESPSLLFHQLAFFDDKYPTSFKTSLIPLPLLTWPVSYHNATVSVTNCTIISTFRQYILNRYTTRLETAHRDYSLCPILISHYWQQLQALTSFGTTASYFTQLELQIANLSQTSYIHSAISHLLVFRRSSLHLSWRWTISSCDLLLTALSTIVSPSFHSGLGFPITISIFPHRNSFGPLNPLFSQILYVSSSWFFLMTSSGSVFSWFSSLSAGWFALNNCCFTTISFRLISPDTPLQCLHLHHPDISELVQYLFSWHFQMTFHGFLSYIGFLRFLLVDSLHTIVALHLLHSNYFLLIPSSYKFIWIILIFQHHVTLFNLDNVIACILAPYI